MNRGPRKNQKNNNSNTIFEVFRENSREMKKSKKQKKKTNKKKKGNPDDDYVYCLQPDSKNSNQETEQKKFRRTSSDNYYQKCEYTKQSREKEFSNGFRTEYEKEQVNPQTTQYSPESINRARKNCEPGKQNQNKQKPYNNNKNKRKSKYFNPKLVYSRSIEPVLQYRETDQYYLQDNEIRIEPIIRVKIEEIDSEIVKKYEKIHDFVNFNNKTREEEQSFNKYLIEMVKFGKIFQKNTKKSMFPIQPGQEDRQIAQSINEKIDNSQKYHNSNNVQRSGKMDFGDPHDDQYMQRFNEYTEFQEEQNNFYEELNLNYEDKKMRIFDLFSNKKEINPDLSSALLNNMIVSKNYDQGTPLNVSYFENDLIFPFFDGINHLLFMNQADFDLKNFIDKIKNYNNWNNNDENLLKILNLCAKLFELGVIDQFIPLLLEIRAFTSNFMKSSIFVLVSINSIDDFEKNKRIFNFILVFIYFYRVIQQLLPTNKRILSENEFSLAIQLYLTLFTNMVYKFKKIVKIEGVKNKMALYEDFVLVLGITNEALSFCSKEAFEYKISFDEFDEYRTRLCEEDFRKALLYLNKTIVDSNPPLKPILKSSPYCSTEDYLEVNFKLLKEDCFLTLKKGIKSYEESQKKDIKNEYIRIHQAEVVQLVLNQFFIGLKIKIFFGQRHEHSVKRYLTRHFLSGNLVVLSKDFFQSFFCFVLKDIKDILKGDNDNGYIEAEIQLADSLVNVLEVYEQLKDFELIIAESPAYYESYRHVLAHIQTMDLDFPLHEVIVECRNQNNCQPGYLQYFERFEGLGDLPEQYNNPMIKDKINKWLANKKVIMDDSQKEALLFTFQKRLALIQGPPGTGKTFVGVNIVRILLDVFHQSLKKPILIICYTNHALDQFLEFILSYTKNITRLGARSKSLALEKYLLSERKRQREFRGYFDERIHLYRDRRSQTIDRFFHASKDFIMLSKCNFIWDKSLVNSQQNDEFFEILEKIYETRYEDFFRVYYKKINSDFRENKESLKKNVAFVKDQLKMFEGTFTKFGVAVLFWLKIFSFTMFSKYLDELMPKRGAITGKRDDNNGNCDDNQDDYRNEREKYDEEFDIDWEIEKKKKKTTQKITIALEKITSGDHSKIIRDCKQKLAEKNKKYNLNFDTCKQFYLDMFDNDSENNSTEPEFENYRDSPNKMDLKLRYWLHYYLCEKVRRELFNELLCSTEKVNYCNKKIEKFEYKALQSILSTQDIVGMTTTCAAKYKSLLRSLPSKVIVVEEAAEVLEAHILTSITKKTEHLILIGDHMQLRPSVNDEDLIKKYNLDISMFERLVNNGIENKCLKVQRRMRPEISALPKLFYPDLQDHASVQNRPNIMKLKSNLLFFDHKWPESKMIEVDSYINRNEAEFIIEFCGLLQRNGFKTENITILSLYTGQLLTIKNIKNRNSYIKNVRVKTVDDYQGEECDIILLSLVRSNTSDNIGFLKNDNRVNVALSRAKLGLFIFGNSECIMKAELKIFQKTKIDSLWIKVLKYMKRNQLIKDEIKFGCEYHDIILGIKTIEEMKKFKEFHCEEKCEMKLSCNHLCQRPCHKIIATEVDPDGHANFKCITQCTRNHGCTHRCKYPCGELLDNHICMSEVSYELPECGHQIVVKCDTKERNRIIKCFKKCNKTLICGHKCELDCWQPCSIINHCKVQCKKSLPCGHLCARKCSETCTSNCQEKVIITLARCGHQVPVECWLSSNHLGEIKCQEKCIKQMDCGHTCSKNCSEKCDWASICGQACLKKKDCGHSCLKKCSAVCENSQFCDQPCNQILKCSHLCRNQCKDPCVKDGKCLEKCKKTLKCGHPCVKKCIHECTEFDSCSEKCKKLLVCGHPCENRCNNPCQSKQECSQKCEKHLPCDHNCTNKCGEPCIQNYQCLENCGRYLDCGHLCKNKCGEPCTPRSECQDHCTLTMKCGHPCLQICGYNCIKNPICDKKCEKTIPSCKHPCKNSCSDACTSPKECEEQCSKSIYCGHMCTNKCGQKCSDKLNCLEPCKKKLDCGHECPALCNAPCLPKEECKKKCSRKLACTHSCSGICGHDCKTIICQEECVKPLKCKHNCPNKCSEKCIDASECKQKIQFETKCGHDRVIECHENGKTTVQCLVKCKTPLECGHICANNCGDECTPKTKCNEPCRRILECGHLCPKKCCDPCLEVEKCKQACKKQMNCGHLCINKCSEDCSDKSECTATCSKFTECGHPCSKKCFEPCTTPSECKIGCSSKIENCRHKCQHPCDKPHIKQEECTQKVNHTFPKCGHKVEMLCKERVEINKLMCTQKCGKNLPCKHQCQKFCGEICLPNKHNPYHRYSFSTCQKNEKLKIGDNCKCTEGGGCQTEREVKLKKCVHKVKIKCSVKTDNFIKNYECTQIVKEPLNCGCSREKKCFEQDSKFKSLCDCNQMRDIELFCGHILRSKEEKSQEQIKKKHKCAEKCNKPFPCGHLCIKKCWECKKEENSFICQATKCKQICGKEKKCGHECKKKCGDICELPKDPPCDEGIKFTRPCDHEDTHPCHIQKNEYIFQNPCAQDCKINLKCGHKCEHKCSECILVKRRVNVLGNERDIQLKTIDLGLHFCDCLFGDEDNENELFD